MELLFLLYCKSVLNFNVPDFRYYNSIALSALDATFSAQANYTGVIHVVDGFCDNYRIDNRTHAICPAAIRNQLQDLTPERFADVVGNHQKVSGRLKVALFLDCLQVFHEFGIETYQDMQTQFDNPALEAALSGIHGIGSATLSYLYMLVGDSNDVKVDRHIRAFATKATDHANLTDDQIKSLFRFASEELSKDYPGMTPRHLDHIVWVYQRSH